MNQVGFMLTLQAAKLEPSIIKDYDSQVQVRLNGFPYFVNTYSGCFGAFLNCGRHFQIMVFMDIHNFNSQCNLCQGKMYLIVIGRAKCFCPEVTQASPSNANEGVANGKYEPLQDGQTSIFLFETETF